MAFYFQERQTFTQWWLWLIVGATTLSINSLFIYGIVQQLVLGIPWGDEPLGDEVLLMLSVVILTVSTGLSLLFFNSVLEVRIDNRSLEYRYAPLIRTWRRVEADAVKDAKQRRYFLPGYGIKRDFDGTRIFTVKGREGIELTLAGGTRLLIGTQQPDQFLAAVRKMKHSNLS